MRRNATSDHPPVVPRTHLERIPGQQRDPDDADDVEGGSEDEEKRDHDSDVERPADDDPYDSRNTTGAGDHEALGGHANTGHSPPDAT